MSSNESLLKELKVLFVEDEVNISKLIKEALSDYFNSFSTASNGKEGLDKFKKIRPDIVITDIMMPELDGLEMTKKIKAIDEDIPIIVLSAFSDKDKLLKAIDIGISKYFIKPFDPEEVLEYLVFLTEKLNKHRMICLNKYFSFDNNTKSLYEEEKLINITKREKEFISLLVQNRSVITKTELIKYKLWKDEDVSDERLRTFIKRLRQKTSKELIKNISGQGYLISEEEI